MPTPNFVILYVESATASAEFYEALLGRKPIESAPTFVLFEMHGGVMLGLWRRAGVEPASGSAIGGSEIAFSVATHAELDATHTDWHWRGLAIAQAPTTMDFGRTFVALDPDGHRLRVFAPNPS